MPEEEEDESVAAEAEDVVDEDEEYEMDAYKAKLAKVEKHIGELVQIVKHQNDRIESLVKESPPEDDAEAAPEVASEEQDTTVDEPDEDAATDGGENHGEDTGDAFTKGSTPKPVSKNVGNTADVFGDSPFIQKGDPGRIRKAVNDGAFLRKAWREGDIATVANAAATASRMAVGKGHGGEMKKMNGNDSAKKRFATWAHKHLSGRDL